VSTGLDGHNTPVGEFTIRRKFVSDTMANLGPEAGDDSYRIEDVPWTQYFDGSFALHGAFWHTRFGLRRSHGCVNLSPQDARWVFEHTWPEVPEGWHGVSTERTGFRGSRVVVTE
jgi:lipoprotein-anchoring transpeptidase ErfK/SrfK